MSTDYNGYPNRATWLVNLHLSNDYDLYHETREMVAATIPNLRDQVEEIRRDTGVEVSVAGLLVDPLRDHVETITDADMTDGDAATLFRDDLVRETLAHVDWRYLAELYYEDALEAA